MFMTGQKRFSLEASEFTFFLPPFKQQKSGRDEDWLAQSLFAEFEGVEGAEIRESNPQMNLWYSKFNSNVHDLMACC